jgi:hypothetical protein
MTSDCYLNDKAARPVFTAVQLVLRLLTNLLAL